MNTKGQAEVFQILIFLILVFVLAVGFFIVSFVTTEVADGIQDSTINNSATVDAIDSLRNFGSSTIDRGFFLLFAGLVIALMITSFLVRIHPIFMFLWIFVLGITLILGLYLGNAYENIQNVSALSGVDLPLMDLILGNIVIVTLAAGALSIIIVFVKFTSRKGAASPV